MRPIGPIGSNEREHTQGNLISLTCPIKGRLPTCQIFLLRQRNQTAFWFEREDYSTLDRARDHSGVAELRRFRCYLRLSGTHTISTRARVAVTGPQHSPDRG